METLTLNNVLDRIGEHRDFDFYVSDMSLFNKALEVTNHIFNMVVESEYNGDSSKYTKDIEFGVRKGIRIILVMSDPKKLGYSIDLES